MRRFVQMVENFKSFPPMHEIARVSILMPGDKGYPKSKIDRDKAERAVKQSIQPAGNEPEWMRQRRLKEERKRAGGVNG